MARHAGAAARRRNGAGFRTAASAATSRCTSSTRRCRRARPSRSTWRAFARARRRIRTRARTCGCRYSGQGGLLETWYRFDAGLGLSVRRLRERVVRTMQNRVDSAQMRVPGYRDRVVHVKFTKEEGGMNLSMPRRGDRRADRTRASRGGGARRALPPPPAKPGDLRGTTIAGCASAPRWRRSANSCSASRVGTRIHPRRPVSERTRNSSPAATQSRRAATAGGPTASACSPRTRRSRGRARDRARRKRAVTV